jgi:hypothetical protein
MTQYIVGSSLFDTGSSFNEPATQDQTSAPPESLPGTPPLGGQKKKKPFGPKVRNPGALAAAIAKSKKAFQSSHKYGST